MKTYNSFEDIEFELKRLKLERQIGLEELKGLKGDLADNLKPAQWIGTATKFAWKYGLFLLVKKIFK